MLANRAKGQNSLTVLMTQRIVVHPRCSSAYSPARLQELLTACLTFHEIVVSVVRHLMNVSHRLSVTLVVMLRHLDVQSIVHRQRVTTFVVHTLAQVQEVRLNAQPLQSLLMSSSVTQVDDSNRVAVEVAVKGLNHIRVDAHTRETIINAHAHVTNTCITKHRITPDQGVITITQMQLLRQLWANAYLIDIQARISCPHGGSRARQARSHQAFLKDIVLARKAAAHNVLCDPVVRRLRTVHGLSHRLPSIG